MELLEDTKKLYGLTGKLNIYIYMCCQENKPDIVRLKEELNQIRKIILDIENKLDNL